MKIGTRSHEADDRQQCTGKPRGKVVKSDNDGQDRQGNEQTRYSGVSHMAKSEEQLAKEAVAPLLNAQHFVKFTDGNLNADSRQKAD
jgi:hypothetical protein